MAYSSGGPGLLGAPSMDGWAVAPWERGRSVGERGRVGIQLCPLGWGHTVTFVCDLQGVWAAAEGAHICVPVTVTGYGVGVTQAGEGRGSYPLASRPRL